MWYAIVPEADLAELRKLGDLTVLETSSKFKHLTVVEIHPRGPGIASKGGESPR